MKRLKDIPALVLAVLLGACLVWFYATRDASSNGAGAKKLAAISQTLPIDEPLLPAARQMASAADTNEEQSLAREALRLADHELDLAFATALREATQPSAPASGPLKQLADRVTQLKARIITGEEQIAKLTRKAATDEAASDPLDLAKAQLALDQDELEDAQQDLARQGGDRHAKIERALAEHEAAQHEATQPPKVSVAGRTGTLSEQFGAWLSLGNRKRQLEAARQQAVNHAAPLEREHEALEKTLTNKPAPGSAPAPDQTPFAGTGEETAARVARLRGLAGQRKTLAEFDKRIEDSQQLADVYKRWSAVIETRRRDVLHLLLGSLVAIFAVLLAAILIGRAIRHAFGRQTDRKRLHQLRVMADIAVQVVGALIVLLIIFGPPTQTSTIIGLATAGLTVALKDFIVAFFGWFALMGRNGLRVGDWVEIEGVSGEVIEIGLLKTVLLEMGNWAATGHPTGRRVAFVNSFAIEGHYFNFSTAGQWLWDELQVTLPTTGDPYQMAQQIRQTVERETEVDANAAEQDWERVTRQYGTRPFSAKPAVDLRPSVNGLTVVVRYITRAPQRYEMKSRLFDVIVDLLHKPAGSTTPGETPHS